MIFARIIQKTIFSILFACMVAALTACQAETADIYAQRTIKQPEIVQPELKPDVRLDIKQDEKPTFDASLKWITLDGGARDMDFNPRTDIIFVIDDSDSMKATQENLSRNINRFIEGFRKNRMIDFRIGVISVWDSSERFAAKNKSGYTQGELRKIKDGNGKTLKSRYVSRFQGFESALAATLKIGVTPYDQGGPETEQVFAPLSEALKKTGRGAVNEDFFRDDAHLVVVVVTDAEDASELSPEQMAEELFAMKGGNKDKVSAYGVLVRKNDPDSVKDWGLKIHPKYNPQCFETIERVTKSKKVVTETKNNGQCTGFGPNRIDQFILAANASASAEKVRSENILSLNQRDFGKDLAKIGSHITVKVLEKEISLDRQPITDDQGNILIRVRYGSPESLAEGKGKIIPNQANSGWVYDPSRNSVRISGEVQYDFIEGGRFAVDIATY